jgi:hypothetical protein
MQIVNNAARIKNGRWRIEGEGREVKREEKVGLGVWDRALLSLPVRERPWKCKPER